MATGNVASHGADKMETDEKQEKASPVPASTPIPASTPVAVSTPASDKAAKRRITPMAIDP